LCTRRRGSLLRCTAEEVMVEEEKEEEEVAPLVVWER
jgi:hypothetical protein